MKKSLLQIEKNSFIDLYNEINENFDPHDIIIPDFTKSNNSKVLFESRGDYYYLFKTRPSNIYSYSLLADYIAKIRILNDDHDLMTIEIIVRLKTSSFVGLICFSLLVFGFIFFSIKERDFFGLIPFIFLAIHLQLLYKEKKKFNKFVTEVLKAGIKNIMA